MDLRDYPRPKDDTGIGVHWSAGFPVMQGLGRIRDRWLPELIALGVKWVKIARADGGAQFDELLLAHDIMPIVRLYRPRPNPGRLDAAMLRLVKDHVAAGVRYFEFNNEPDLANEWQDSDLPPDAIQIVAANAIADMEAILALGGYPAIPAVTVGSRWDLAREICRQGRRDLLREPVWQAVHNYSLNHPLDYPYDAGHQAGAAYTQEFYERVAGEDWDGDAWGGWSLERVNEERRTHAHPGDTAFEDASCWRGYERFDALIRAQIGRSLPVLATENGYIVRERCDWRYPATTPQLHMAQTLEACRAMMASSARFDRAPDYYFCTAFWLLGNYSLGTWASQWEGAAWYSSRWPGGALPIVAALKAEPKAARCWHGDGGVAGQIEGYVRGGAGLTLRLSGADGWVERAYIGADERYRFVDLPLGSYMLSVLQAPGTVQPLRLSAEQPSLVADIDLAGVSIVYEDGVLRGTVRGGAGLTLRLERPADGWTAEQAADGAGCYRFEGLGAGRYILSVVGAGVAQAGIVLDGQTEVVVDLIVPGWGWQLSDGGPGPGFGVVRCRVAGAPGVSVRLWADGWAGITRRAGDKAEYGADACEFAPLGAGIYYVQPENGAIKGASAPRARVTVDGRRVLWVTFTNFMDQ